MKYRSLLLLGAPGCGKGTQGKVLGAIPNLLHFSMGDAFRNLKKDSELGKVFVQYSSKGQLVPDDFTVKLWRQTVADLEQAKKFNAQTDTLLLDGIPRNPAQAEMMKNDLNVLAVLYLGCPDTNKLIQRLKRRALLEGRADDANEDVIRNRLAVYEKETRPLLDFYGPNLIKEIDGSQSIIATVQDVLKVLVTLL